MSDDRPFEWEHDVWVKHGWCPAVRRTKAWCNRVAGHEGEHMSPRVHPDYRITQEFWPDTERITG